MHCALCLVLMHTHLFKTEKGDQNQTLLFVQCIHSLCVQTNNYKLIQKYIHKIYSILKIHPSVKIELLPKSDIRFCTQPTEDYF